MFDPITAGGFRRWSISAAFFLLCDQPFVDKLRAWIVQVFFFVFFYPNIHFSWQLDTVMIWCVIWACLGSCVVSVQAVRAAHFVWTSRQIQTSHVWFCVKSVCHHLLLQGFCPSSICHHGFEDDAFVSFNNSVTFYSLNFEIFKEKLISKQHFHSSPTPDTGAHCRFTAACSVVDDLLGFSHFFSSYFLN